MKNMMEYKEDDFLQLSGLQHYVFCKRQWALAYMEMQWSDNYWTIDGDIMHEKVHDACSFEKRGNTIISRGMPIRSFELGLVGECDVVEFKKCKKGILVRGLEGQYEVYPVEYKRGSKKSNDCDEVQVIAQAMCLEEMLCCEIPKCYLYYGEHKKRHEIVIDKEKRERIRELALDMHRLYDRRHTPKVKPNKACSACSLKDMCLPKLTFKNDAKEYMSKVLEGK